LDQILPGGFTWTFAAIGPGPGPGLFSILV